MTEEIKDDNSGGIITIDTETTMNNTIGKNKASPFCPDNYIVMYGAKGYGFKKENLNRTGTSSKRKSKLETNINPKTDKNIVLVGHNIKFDIHHLRQAPSKIDGILIEEWLPNNKIWDTQLAEYILTGMEHKYASLDELCTKYGLPLKDDKVKEVFASGKGADTIDTAVLEEYLKNDVESTEQIAYKQMEHAYNNNKLPLIEAMMDALLAIEEMEYNGLAIDHSRLHLTRSMLIAKEVDLHKEIKDGIETLIPILKGKDFNIDSNKQLSTILFGGEITFEHKIPAINKKTGKKRNKIIKEEIKLVPAFDGSIHSTPNANGFKVDEEVLSDILRSSFFISKPWSDTVKKILSRKKLIKELNTYYEGLSELVFPDGLIHHNINMCATDTGRTSASEPNSQNIPATEDSDVKKLFVSRWGEDGCIISADYKQIEVIALAYLSQDSQLIADLLNGVDVHEAVGWEYYGRHYKMSKDERRVIKTVNFGLIYGGTANALASQAGIPASEVKKIIKAFYNRYPEVKMWQENNILQVSLSRVYNGKSMTKGGLPSGTGWLLSDTGRVYTFHEKDNPFKTGEVNFKPTEIKNYPVQGFATGDLVLTMAGVLWRKLKQAHVLKNNCRMINLVHDELVFDCKKGHEANAARLIKKVLEDAPKYMKDIYNIDLGLPTKVEVTIGDNWKEQKVVAF